MSRNELKQIVLRGFGVSNSRGTFYKAFKFALADYSGVAKPDLFVERHGAHPTGGMTLRGMRLAVMSESGRTYHKQGARWASFPSEAERR